MNLTGLQLHPKPGARPRASLNSAIKMRYSSRRRAAKLRRGKRERAETAASHAVAAAP